MMSGKVLLIYDKNLRVQCDKLPTMLNRASMVYDLLYSYGLLFSEKIQIARSTPATDEELCSFHTKAYINYLKTIESASNRSIDEQQLDTFGLSYDCPILENCYNLISVLAGGSATAAKHLLQENYKTAINWWGGWHHAQEAKAEGFCYVNDVVIAIKILLKKFSKVLYVDLDIHHGDGVETAFSTSRDVLTLSFHNYLPGFYPGTGSVDDVGHGFGKYFCINVPFLDSFNDSNYINTFSEVFSSVVDVYKPEALVVQCGADVLNEDPIGQANITPNTMGECVRQILSVEKPTLFLGGGGYNFPNTARYWTYLTSIIINEDLPTDIPDESIYFTNYSPTYEITIQAGKRKDSNTEKYLQSIKEKIKEYCKCIKETNV